MRDLPRSRRGSLGNRAAAVFVFGVVGLLAIPALANSFAANIAYTLEASVVSAAGNDDELLQQTELLPVDVSVSAGFISPGVVVATASLDVEEITAPFGGGISFNGLSGANASLEGLPGTASGRSAFSIDLVSTTTSPFALRIDRVLEGASSIRLIELLGGGGEQEILNLTTSGVTDITLGILTGYRLEFESVSQADAEGITTEIGQFTGTASFVLVPEPATASLLLAGLGFLARRRR
ncbi:MAG: PEP-CTERM sorting domain-containing protein [Myxococcota bacterium]